MKRIYLDYAASTPVTPDVLSAMQPYFSERFGNPGSLHSFGQEAIAAIDRSRETIATLIGAEFRDVLFTSSATEANNLALRGAVAEFRKINPGVTPRIVISSVEHESILETARDLEREGVEVNYAPVDNHGHVSLKDIKTLLDPSTALVSIMYAQNETGTVEPVAEISQCVRNFRGNHTFPLFHTDAAQAFQFFRCNVDELGVDLMTISSHKIYGPKGAGALYVRGLSAKALALKAEITGGGQEFGVRSGTENVPAIVGFAKAAEIIAPSRESENKKIKALTDTLWKKIQKIYPKAELNGAQELPNILNIYFPGYQSEELLTKWDLAGLAASSGSACRSRAVTSSYVIEALGHSKERARSSVRFSLGHPTTAGDINAALAIINETFSGHIA